jgi:hypothetical protein
VIEEKGKEKRKAVLMGNIKMILTLNTVLKINSNEQKHL